MAFYKTSYHNTTGEAGSQLAIAFRKANKQDDSVLSVFKKYRVMSPSEAWSRMIDEGLITKDTPITSIRRSINTLTGSMKLVKTSVKKTGLYGRPEYIWKIFEQ